MIVYEVTLEVDRDVLDEYREWLGHHVHQMLQFEGFERASIQRRRDGESQRETFVVDYHVNTAAHLDAYLRDHAAGMRADGQRRFDGRFSASRRILEVLDERS